MMPDRNPKRFPEDRFPAPSAVEKRYIARMLKATPKTKSKTMPKPMTLLMAMLKRIWKLISKPMKLMPKRKLMLTPKSKPPSS
jgi:hypothetical protein